MVKSLLLLRECSRECSWVAWDIFRSKIGIFSIGGFQLSDIYEGPIQPNTIMHAMGKGYRLTPTTHPCPEFSLPPTPTPPDTTLPDPANNTTYQNHYIIEERHRATEPIHRGPNHHPHSPTHASPLTATQPNTT